jgi:hypothetical protein
MDPRVHGKGFGVWGLCFSIMVYGFGLLEGHPPRGLPDLRLATFGEEIRKVVRIPWYRVSEVRVWGIWISITSPQPEISTRNLVEMSVSSISVYKKCEAVPKKARI